MSNAVDHVQSSAHPQGTNRPVVLASIMLAMFMSAIEATIVATAMPSIVADLGGFASFSWVFSVFMLMQAVTIPIYGKLSDLFGRKPIFVVGVVIFLIGSLLCGLATSMTLLIVYRVVQGIGAGAVQPVATTIVGDIYTMEERGKIQGYLASVWGISSVIGPAAGGVFVQFLHWHWVFWVNLPLGILAIAGVVLYLHEPVTRKKHQLDFAGSALMLVAVGALMFLFIRGGTAWPWGSWQVLALGAVFAVFIVLFAFREQSAKEPIMPLDLWKHRLILVCNLASLTTGGVMIGISTFLPTYVQGVMQYSPTIAGFTLAMMSIGWPLASTVGGRFMKRLGFRKLAVTGGVFLLAGSLFFIAMKPEYGPLWAAAGSFLVGVGMGLANTTFIVGIQSSVEWNMRGAATASNMFMRMLGTTIGASFLGGIVNARLSAYLAAHGGGAANESGVDIVNRLLDSAQRAKLPQTLVHTVQQGLSSALHGVYWAVLAFSAVSLAIVVFLPRPNRS